MFNIIAIAGSLISIISAILAAAKYCKRNSGSLDIKRRYARYDFLYPQSLVKQLLVQAVDELPDDSRFIDYSLAIRNDYYKNSLTMAIQTNGQARQIRQPYAEIIDYIENPDSRIRIRGGKVDGTFELSPDLKKKTDAVLKEYLDEKPQTTNGRTLRLSSIVRGEGNDYECRLQYATYFDQVRTNLTLDIPLEGDIENTIRTLDLANGSDNGLKPLSESIMANTIGVSAIWYTPYPNNRNKKDRIQFFLKKRRKQTGVFFNLLGTVSGVAEPPANGIFTESTLEEYLSKEMLREFCEETGYNSFAAANGLNPDDIMIKPLAFVRELIRGGKPQFFFVIRTPYVDDTQLRKYFENSYNGKMEFNDDILSNLSMCKLSPETQTNLLYALRHIQKMQHLNYIDLDI